jgi:HD-like signal output (HDOD) protein
MTSPLFATIHQAIGVLGYERIRKLALSLMLMLMEKAESPLSRACATSCAACERCWRVLARPCGRRPSPLARTGRSPATKRFSPVWRLP